MAILKSSNKSSGQLETLYSDLATAISPREALHTQHSFEDFTPAGMGSIAFGNTHEEYVAGLRGIFKAAVGGIAEATGVNGDSNASFESFGSAGLDGAAMIAMAVRSPATMMAYANAALNPAVTREEGVTVVEPSNNPAYGYSTEAITLSNEAFDARVLDSLRTSSVTFAFSAAMQDEFNSAFFKPVTISPDGSGLEVALRRTVIMQEQRHPETGEPLTTFKARNLLDAFTEASLLINEATRIYPRVIVGNAKSEEHFVDADIIAPRETLGANGAIITTAPIKVGSKIGLLGAGANERTVGQPDQTDAIDGAVSIIATYYRIKSDKGESIVRFNTTSYAHNSFQRAFEGQNRRIALDFHTNAIFVDANTLDYNTGEKAEALSFLEAAPFENVTLQMDDHITGEGNLQYGWVKVGKTSAELHSARVHKEDGTFDVIRDEATLETLRETIVEFELVGYDVKAYYANTNKRFLGTLIDTVEERRRYIVPLLPPISVQTPITGTPTQTELSGPMNAQRMTNSINGVTKILETRDLLRDMVKNVDYGDNSTEVAGFEGFAHTMVRPYLYEADINLADVVQSTSSSNRHADIQAAIVGAIRFGVATMYTESRYQPFIDSLNGTAGSRPDVVIGTDPRTAAYLLIDGEPRLVGLGMQTKVVVSYDYRMRGEIAVSFVRNNTSGDVDLGSFGVFANMPELVTQVRQPINGSLTDVTQVQNRNLHVVFLPVMAWFTVTGLEQAAAKELPFRTSF